jgi:WD40-like Beta Propeller Repeat
MCDIAGRFHMFIRLLRPGRRLDHLDEHYLIARLIFLRVSPSGGMAHRLAPLALVLLISGAWFTFACEQTVLIADEVAGSGAEAMTGSGGVIDGSGGQASVGGEGGAPEEPTADRPVFSEPQIITELSDPNSKDQDPTLTGDLLEIFFFSERAGEPDLWTSTRTSLDAPWQAPTQVLELSSPELDINPAVSLDGLRLWFHSQRDPDGIWLTERTSRAEVWNAPKRVDALGGELAPGPSADELRLGISVSRSETGREVYETTRFSITDPWSVPLPIEGINSPMDDATPFLLGDGRQIFFNSARTGAGDIYWTSRPTLTDPVSEPIALVELNDPDELESHPHVSPDGTRIFFGSARSGNTDLYEAVLIP